MSEPQHLGLFAGIQLPDLVLLNISHKSSLLDHILASSNLLGMPLRKATCHTCLRMLQIPKPRLLYLRRYSGLHLSLLPFRSNQGCCSQCRYTKVDKASLPLMWKYSNAIMPSCLPLYRLIAEK